jgi:tetratricopeptide (TPR) repeat protein
MRYPNDIKGYLNRGNYYFESREYQKAIKDYLTALNIEPNNHRILYNTGNCFLYLNNPELALQSYDRALHIKPDYTKVLQNKAIATQLLK